MHTSIKLDTPIELINIAPINPLISKCQIKVCYVGDEPNRNRSVITKDVARQMANSLPGSPIVGFFNENKEDYEEHNRIIDISNGKFEIKDTTKPYGFVDLNAKAWFTKYLDDDAIEREYLVTEGYLWTGQYPECERIIAEGNNQSMELDEKTLNAFWTKDNNGKPQFFIINEAIISKLCILGEDNEPCFEGANITAPTIQFSFDDGFKNQLFSMMTELKDLLNKGGAKVFNQYAVEIGDGLWRAIMKYLAATYPSASEDSWEPSIYYIKSIYEEGTQKFAILANWAEGTLFRMNFTYNEDGFAAEELVAVEEQYVPKENPTFSLEDTKNFVLEFMKNDDEKEKCPKCGKPLDECDCDKDEDDDFACDGKKKKKYNLEEVTEYVELQAKYEELENKFNLLVAEKETADATIASLTEFKNASDRKEKQSMIESFYMLSDEDKEDVINNIDTYSLDDIEAKLSIICVRNKVNFNLDNDDHQNQGPTVYTLGGGSDEDDALTPAWVKAAMKVAKKMN